MQKGTEKLNHSSRAAQPRSTLGKPSSQQTALALLNKALTDRLKADIFCSKDLTRLRLELAYSATPCDPDDHCTALKQSEDKKRKTTTVSQAFVVWPLHSFLKDE